MQHGDYGNIVSTYVNLDGENIYLLASRHGHLEIMKYIEKLYNVDVLLKNIHGENAYLLACACGHLEIVKYLDDKSVCYIFEAKNNYGFDAYLSACANDKLEIMKHLERKYNWNVRVETCAGDNAYSLNSTKSIKEHLEKEHGWFVGVKTGEIKKDCEEKTKDTSVSDLVMVIKNKLTEKNEKILALENELKTIKKMLIKLAL